MDQEENLQRRLARTICALFQAAPASVASQVCNTDPFKSDLDATMITLLIQEGLPLSKPGSNSLLSCCIACGKGFVHSLKRGGCDLDATPTVSKHSLLCLSMLISSSACRGEVVEDKHLEETKHIVLNLISVYTLDHKSRLFHAPKT